MNFTAALDVAIGVVFLYLVFSMICMSVNEAIASITRLRARTLASEINRILDEDTLRARFWNTGRILSLARRNASSSTAGTDLIASRAPSYIASTTFARALIQATGIVGDSGDRKTADDSALDNLSDDSVLKWILKDFRAEAGGDIIALRAEIASWFDEVMERTAGVYKRRLKLISFIVALAIAALINADSITVSRALWFDGTLRAQIARSGIGVVAEDDYLGRMTKVAEIDKQLRPFPIGWDFDGVGATTDWYRSAFGIIGKMVGLLLTAFAAILGAPFWFDLLSKFVNLRGAGPVGSVSQPGIAQTGPLR